MLHQSPSIRVELDDQIATLWLDCRGQAQNRFTLESLDELECALRIVQRLPCLDILVIRSAKPSGFSPGYDLDVFAEMRSPVERSAFAARGQQITQLIGNLSRSALTVAIVEGECRSAGLELALACDYRVVVARPDTVFSFPEVNRGLIPCWGGTLRLPRLVGLSRALDLLLNERELTSREAVSWGLADLAVSDRRARIDIQAFLDKLQDSPRKRAMPRSIGQRLRDSIALMRWTTLKKANSFLADVDNEERPASQAILKAVRLSYSSSAEGLAAERNAIVELGETAAHGNAIARSRLALQPARIYPEPINPVSPVPERVGIVGGGVTGSALACWLTLRGRNVVLQEYSDDSLLLANERLDARFRDAVARGQVTSLEADQAKKNIRRTTSWTGFEDASFVIEAADEDLGVKRGVFYELEQRVRPRSILVTASSTIRVDAIQAELSRPGRVAGVHFLDAACQNSLVEIVRAPGTDSGTLATLDSWLRMWGKTPVLVSDRPGRLVQRVQLAYLSEAVLLVAEGLPAELIDRNMRRFGMVRGPLETVDTIDFDALARLIENLQLARGDNFARNLMLERMRSFGWNGQESGEGFYRYSRGRAKPNHLARVVMWRDVEEDAIGHYIFDPQEALNVGVERLVLRSINELAACLCEEHDADPGMLDLAMAIGAGWAPHRGGPLRHADYLGLTAVVERLTEFAERFGKRFEPCVELQRRAEAGESFYGSRVPEEAITLPMARRMAG